MRSKTIKKLVLSIAVIMSCFLFINTTQAAVLFSDNFDSGANSAWGNEIGNWVATSGVYDSQNPNNSPPTYSSVSTLPNLTDFTLDVDINNLSDGGIFLRSNDTSHGVLLVTGGNGKSFNGLYWHILDDVQGYAVFNPVTIPGLQGSNVHLTVSVVGDLYTATIGSYSTSVTTNAFSSGKVALYDYSNQTFDNVVISGQPVPEPASMLLGLVSLIGGLFGLKRKSL